MMIIFCDPSRDNTGSRPRSTMVVDQPARSAVPEGSHVQRASAGLWSHAPESVRPGPTPRDIQLDLTWPATANADIHVGG